MFVEEDIPPKLTGSRALQQHLFVLLQSCNTIRKLTQVHAHIIINGFTQKNFILVKLLSFYITSGYRKYGFNVFQNIQKPSITVWNQIIRGHALNEKPQKSVECFNQMLKAEAKPDGFTYSFLLCACAKWGLLREGEQLHGKVLVSGHCLNVFVQTNLVNLYAMSRSRSVKYARHVFDEMCERNVVSWNSLLAGYTRCGDVVKARQIFDEMPDRNVISWTIMIAGLAQNGRCKQALSLFYQMRKARVDLDQVILIATLSACAELGDLKLGMWIHWYTDKVLCVRKQWVLVSLYNALIHMYASCGVIEEAYKIFREMPERTTVSWTSIITGLAKHGFGEEALHVFREMLSLGRKETRPDEITFIGALCACSHAGFVDEGRSLFKLMTQSWGIKPMIEHYGCMIDLLSRAGYLHEAQQLIDSMHMKQNDVVWGALLGGCRIHKNVMLASDVAQNLIVELNPEQAAGYLVLLSNVYAAAKRWIDFASVRKKMVEMGAKKPPGRSWIQINGTMHDFVAADVTHEHASSIYKALTHISRQVEWEGYKLDESVLSTCVGES